MVAPDRAHVVLAAILIKLLWYARFFTDLTVPVVKVIVQMLVTLVAGGVEAFPKLNKPVPFLRNQPAVVNLCLSLIARHSYLPIECAPSHVCWLVIRGDGLFHDHICRFFSTTSCNDDEVGGKVLDKLTRGQLFRPNLLL